MSHISISPFFLFVSGGAQFFLCFVSVTPLVFSHLTITLELRELGHIEGEGWILLMTTRIMAREEGR